MDKLSTFLRILVRSLRRGGIAMTMLMAFATGVAQAGDLKILHINDHHSHLKPDGRMSLNLDGQST
ncbi:MAG: hypothetical protein ACPIC3_04545, partial [Candidatus Puniceispirillaceae bacterium]